MWCVVGVSDLTYVDKPLSPLGSPSSQKITVVLQSHFPFTLFGQILQTTFPLMPWSLPQLSLFGGLGVFPVSLFPVWLTTSGFPDCLASFPVELETASLEPVELCIPPIGIATLPACMVGTGSHRAQTTKW